MNELMDGVTVLSRSDIMIMNPFLSNCTLISFALAVICMFVLEKTESDTLLSIMAISVLLSTVVCIGGLILSITNPIPSGEYRYKVTIDDTVNVNEFLAKYSISDTDSLIHTIVKK